MGWGQADISSTRPPPGHVWWCLEIFGGGEENGVLSKLEESYQCWESRSLLKLYYTAKNSRSSKCQGHPGGTDWPSPCEHKTVLLTGSLNPVGGPI